jgi:NAD-dependent dihydropyrimidine dehydrogenase PreA subunit
MAVETFNLSESNTVLAVLSV